MSGRHYSRPHPPLRQRTDDALPPCTEDDNYRVYFRLLDASPGDVPQIRTEALAICKRCEIRPACWAERSDETWVKVLDGRKKSGGAYETPRPPRRGPALAVERAERKARLIELAERGYSLADAAEELGVEPRSLRRWSRANDAPYGDPPRPRKSPERKPLPNACGTERGYRRHIQRGEKTCDECRAAHRDEKRERREQERGAA